LANTVQCDVFQVWSEDLVKVARRNFLRCLERGWVLPYRQSWYDVLCKCSRFRCLVGCPPGQMFSLVITKYGDVLCLTCVWSVSGTI